MPDFRCIGDKIMLNFTVGPVQSSSEVLNIGAQQVPYFRTPEFSSVMKENESLIKEFVNADERYRAVYLTGSGTAAMESAVINTLTPEDNVLIVNGGTFGQRFVDLCRLHAIKYTEITLNYGEILTQKHLHPYNNRGYTAFLVNMHETSTGVLYDMDLIESFCEENHLFLIVDAISSFLADQIDIKKLDADVLIMASQKALACPPGISVLILSPDAIHRVHRIPTKCMYLDLKAMLENGERGQTPFTPAVGILLQINARLQEIKRNGGVQSQINQIASLACHFRSGIQGLPLEIASQSMSNAVTPLRPLTASAYDIFNILKDEYNIWVCPNGGTLKDTIFRVGHIGALTIDDNNVLLEALRDLKRRQII